MASVIGSVLILWADWLGKILIHPLQISAGTLVAVIGGSYFLFLMVINRVR